MVLNRWHKRLNQEDIGLSTICVQLHLNTIVAEAVDRAAAKGHTQVLAACTGIYALPIDDVRSR